MPQPKWTLVLIALCVATFVWQNAVGAGVWIYLSFIPALAFRAPWMFVSSIFLHGGLLHLMFNIIALFSFGLYLERLVGHRAFLALFFGAGIIGNLGYALTTPNPFVPAIGASGAVYGVIGALTAIQPTMTVIVGGLPMPLIVVAFLWALLDLAGLFVPTGVASGAHLAGLLVGLIYGIYARQQLVRRWLTLGP